MKKILGILGLLLAIFVVTWLVEPKFASAYNLQNIIRWTSLFGVISIGVAFVIITGGIDLSIGSLIGLVGCLLPMLLAAGYAPAVALLAVVVLSLAIGLLHGLLITRLGLQPFVVTLCGLLFYRGFARWLTHDQVQGFGSSYEGLRQLAIGKVSLGGFALPIPFFLLALAGVLAALFLNRTIWGRYLLALGRNETAARYSGIQIERMKILAYVLCSGTAGLGGILFALDVNSVQPAAHGNFYELLCDCRGRVGGLLPARRRGIDFGGRHWRGRHAVALQCHQRLRHPHPTRVCHYRGGDFGRGSSPTS